jgi:alanine racemase
MQNPFQKSWIELNKNHVLHNVAMLKSLCGSTQVGVVLKGNAYGHGMHEMAKLLENNAAIDWLCVAGADEAIQLRKRGIEKSILAMSYCDANPREIVAQKIHVTVYDIKTIHQLAAAASDLHQTVYVHIKVDTNMCRLGVLPSQLSAFIKKIAWYKSVCIAGIFTHLSDINNENQAFTLQQLRIFEQAVQAARDCLGDQPCVAHALACGALMFENKYDMVRLGTNIYGFWKSSIQRQRFLAIDPHMSLLPVLTWKTRILQVKQIPEGSYVGYNCSFYCDKPRTIAVVPVGYVDGYPRGLSNKGSMIVRGKAAPVIGMVSMNLTTIDVSDVAGATESDEVVVMGGMHDATSIPNVAQLLETVGNEVMTRLNPEIPRVIVES